MLTGLLHDALIHIDDQQNQIDATDTGEHVVNELLVTRNIDNADHTAVGQFEGGEA